jgi:hypothetical protein
MKKSWNKPEITVLVRTRPEEAILGLCKAGPGVAGTGRNDANSQCLAVIGSGGCAGNCDQQYDS